jgi:hypothetical protein
MTCACRSASLFSLSALAVAFPLDFAISTSVSVPSGWRHTTVHVVSSRTKYCSLAMPLLCHGCRSLSRSVKLCLIQRSPLPPHELASGPPLLRASINLPGRSIIRHDRQHARPLLDARLEPRASRAIHCLRHPMTLASIRRSVLVLRHTPSTQRQGKGST